MMMMAKSHHILRTLCVFGCAFQTALAGIATIYLVDPPAPTNSPDFSVSFMTEQGTTRVSALGTGENGRTKYAMDAVQSLLVLNIEGTVQTILSEPTTQKYAFEANQSELKLNQVLTEGLSPDSAPITALEQDCKLDISKQSGECVERRVNRVEWLTDSAGRTTLTRINTQTTTFTGALFPIATVTTSGGGRVMDRGVSVQTVLLALGAGSLMAFARFL
ncbi:hypothetical protein CVT25_015361 [Psilocybe cyanescens]|uniref:Uncharacterized protein n=1 Tax=Psilocybe cyanescens TaxID=93625 RepID=A0A409XPT9_PSICY|nr:hypothetical protein CVT25_015361 [Psilocybe cyanescens]